MYGSSTYSQGGGGGGNSYSQMNQPDVKRPRMEGGGAPDYGNARSMGGAMSASSAPAMPSKPTKVVHIRGLPESVSSDVRAVEADLLDACAQFGPINYVSLGGRGTALVEFEMQRSAEECVSYNSTTDVFVLQQPVYMSFAPMELIPRKAMESSTPTNCLVMQVLNARYPITVDVVSAILKPLAQCSRLLIARRQSIAAYVEFRDPDTARTVKHRLNGCDIYSGCCTLKIEFAKMTRLNVTRNDETQWDYVGGAGGMGGRGDRPSLLQPPGGGGSGQMAGGDELGYNDFGQPVYDGEGGPGPAPGGGLGGAAAMQNNNPAYPVQQMPGAPVPGGGGAGGMPYGSAGDMGGGGGGYGGPQGGMGGGDGYGDMMGGGGMMGQPGGMPQGPGMSQPDGTGLGFDNAVLMVYGLDENKFNCERLFNLFCMYGNVMRIKFLRSKPGTAMVQMGDPVAAERVIRNLGRATIFDKELQIKLSMKPVVEDQKGEPYPLDDGTPSFKNYADCRSNRFLTPDAASKNRVNPPGHTLYFFNAPTDFTEEQLTDLLEKYELPKPKSNRIYEARQGSRSVAGTMEFENVHEASEVLCILNHEPVSSPTSRTPYLLKFTYAGRGDGGGFGGGMGGGGERGGFRGRGRGGGGRGGEHGSPGDFNGGGPPRGGSSYRGGGEFGGRGRGDGGFRGGFRGGPRGGGRGGFDGSRGGYVPRGRGDGGFRGRGRGDFRGAH